MCVKVTCSKCESMRAVNVILATICNKNVHNALLQPTVADLEDRDEVHSEAVILRRANKFCARKGDREGLQSAIEYIIQQ